MYNSLLPFTGLYHRINELPSVNFKEYDIHWLKILYLCLLKWYKATPEHILKLETFYKITGLLAEFQVFYARSNLMSVKTFHDLASVMVDTDISNMFPEVWDLVMIALCIPASSATSERSFSALRRLKTYLRSTMEQNRLSNLAIIHTEQGIASKIDYSNIVDTFANSKKRRLNLIL